MSGINPRRRWNYRDLFLEIDLQQPTTTLEARPQRTISPDSSHSYEYLQGSETFCSFKAIFSSSVWNTISYHRDSWRITKPKVVSQTSEKANNSFFEIRKVVKSVVMSGWNIMFQLHVVLLKDITGQKSEKNKPNYALNMALMDCSITITFSWNSHSRPVCCVPNHLSLSSHYSATTYVVLIAPQ